MTKTDLDFFLNQNIALDLNTFIISLIIASILSLIVQIFYSKLASTFSNKFEFSKNFVVLGITTTIVITIVKSSLALSLGLVGALSIVRFRAAIKEPEELVYLFLVIAIGLGCGAGQIYITVIGTLFALVSIYIFKKFYTKNNLKNFDKLNLAIISEKNLSEAEINNLIDNISGSTNRLELVSLSKSKLNTTINLEIEIDDFKKLNKLINEFKTENIQIVVSNTESTAL